MNTRNTTNTVDENKDWSKDPDGHAPVSDTTVSPYLLRPPRTYEEFLRDRDEQSRSRRRASQPST